MPRTARRTAPIAPAPPEAEQLRELLHVLDDHGTVLMTDDGRQVEVPPTAMVALSRAVEYLASGEPVLIFPADAELSTGEAADILTFSRQYLVRLLDEGQIPYRREGSHRRLLLRDVIRYREKRILEQQEALRDMIQLSEEIGELDMTEEDIATFSRDAGLDDES